MQEPLLGVVPGELERGGRESGQTDVARGSAGLLPVRHELENFALLALAELEEEFAL